ncbi:MAG: ATP-binding cassette domain-containing protein [Candidatus Aminicenantes bacterium]|nr:ATP-binding cassette domain-containing protein [Candidatus Aminicenantes bacterium]
MTPPAEILRLRDVTRGFAEASGLHLALRRVNLTVAEGEFLVITGPSGSGKTTLLHLAALLDRPTSGRIWFDGRDTSVLGDDELSVLRKHELAMIFQNYVLLPYRSVLENVIFRFRYLEHDRTEAVALARQALSRLGLMGLEGRPARRLSAGEMQRVAIARAIVRPPRLLAADEPTGNLDRASTNVIMEHLAGLHRSGITILLVTHNEDLLSYATRHVVCRDGTVEE